MKPQDIPTLRSAAGTWRGVSLECAQVAGTSLTIATVRDLMGPPRRRWFADDGDALAYAIGQADTQGIPLFDLRSGGDD